MKYIYILFLLIIPVTLYCQKRIDHLNSIELSNNFFFTRNGLGWGIKYELKKNNNVEQPTPIEIIRYKDSINIERLFYPYQKINLKDGNKIVACSSIQISKAIVNITDTWYASSLGLCVNRQIEVNGDDIDSFATSIYLPLKTNSAKDIRYFVPGIIYGTTNGLPKNSFFENNEIKEVFIREDRCATPLIGAFLPDSSSLSVINVKPDGATNKSDAETTRCMDMCDESFGFGSVVKTENNNIVSIGYSFPGTEGEITYADWGYPDWQKKVRKWRYRTFPLRNGLKKEFNLLFRFGLENSFSEFYREVWDDVFKLYNPQVNLQDIEKVKVASLQMLSSKVRKEKFGYGIPNWVSCPTGMGLPLEDSHATLGFTGKLLETANFLLYASDEYPEKSELYREQAEGLFRTVISKLPVNPPVAEGFDLNTGELVLALRHETQFYLRTFSDDMKATLRAILYEKIKGREHPDWLTWVKTYADWLVAQQNPEGGFPRSWDAKTGKVNNSAPQSSYNAIPMLVLLFEASRDQKYLKSALKAGEYCHKNQKDGVFIGGTIDNPNATDKEAGTLSLEAYLCLYDVTKDNKWLESATLAADYASTWMYTWNVPMPIDCIDSALHWKKNVSTVGLGLISTGHSLVDAYGAFEADEYAKLYKYTKNTKYLKMAKILLHNTAGTMAIEGRLFDFGELGYQQEHWSLAPLRGQGHNRGWLPWVSCSHLNGIYGLQQFDKKLYYRLSH